MLSTLAGSGQRRDMLRTVSQVERKVKGMNLGGPELLIILAIVLLLFGAKKLPDLARSMGKSTKEFKKGLQEGAQEDEEHPKESQS
jgi:sec-independent protein translocase protein TatA